VWRFEPGPGVALCGPPVPSWKWAAGALAKASVSQHLKCRALREVGFTEQRIPASFDGGRITGRCTSSPLRLDRSLRQTTIFFFLNNSQ
jgi:hypothetical protein